MKLISWNCQGAYRKKAAGILAYLPDLVVVQECERPEKLKDLNTDHVLWFGDNPHKGLAVFAYNSFNIKVLDIYNPAFKYVVPIQVSGPTACIIFAIWANNKADKDGQYVTQVWKAVHYYQELLKKTNVILIGDFNSNSIWDRPKRTGNHSHLVDFLKRFSIDSIYHDQTKEAHGIESQPTFFLYRNPAKSYHLDYCFVSNNLKSKLKSFEIGKFEDWIGLSDHLPLIIEVNS